MSVAENYMYFNLDELKDINFNMDNAASGYEITDNLKIVGIKYNYKNKYEYERSKALFGCYEEACDVYL